MVSIQKLQKILKDSGKMETRCMKAIDKKEKKEMMKIKDRLRKKMDNKKKKCGDVIAKKVVRKLKKRSKPVKKVVDKILKDASETIAAVTGVAPEQVADVIKEDAVAKKDIQELAKLKVSEPIINKECQDMLSLVPDEEIDRKILYKRFQKNLAKNRRNKEGRQKLSKCYNNIKNIIPE